MPRKKAKSLDDCYIMRGISEPIGTRPYKVTCKLLSSGVVLPPREDVRAALTH